MLVHSSLTELKLRGLFDRYRSLISTQSLDRIDEMIGPGWMPIDLVLEHYIALDRLGLDESDIYCAGERAGATIGDALLVAGANVGTQNLERSAWAVVGAFSRMGRRIYEGGSSQYVKLSEDTLLIEHRGNPLYSVSYYRTAHRGFMHMTFQALGIDVTDVKLTTYRKEGSQIDVKVSWK